MVCFDGQMVKLPTFNARDPAFCPYLNVQATKNYQQSSDYHAS